MKIGLFILAIFCGSFLYAQNQLDSLTQAQLKTQEQLDLLIDNLDNHHNQFRNGMVMTVIGSGLSVLGVFSIPEISIVGSVLSIIGGIVVWDSDKWFAKKRQKKVDGNTMDKNPIKFKSMTIDQNPIIDSSQFKKSLKKISIGENVFRVGDRVYYTGGFSKKEATLKSIIFRNGNYLFIIKSNKKNKEIQCTSSFLEPYSK